MGCAARKKEPLFQFGALLNSPWSLSDNGYYLSGAGRYRSGAATVEADESLLRPTRFRSQRIPVEANDSLSGRQLRNRKTWPKPTVVEHQRSCCRQRILAKHRNVRYPPWGLVFHDTRLCGKATAQPPWKAVEKRRRSRRFS